MSDKNYKDYYSILGINRKSSLEEIKRSFRYLAMKYHPDITKNNKSLESKFKDISEAYEVLSNKEMRDKYDKLSEKDWNKKTTKLDEKSVDKKMDLHSFSNFFQSLFGTVKANTIKNIKKINDLEKNITITLEEAYSGVQKDITLPIEEECFKCKGEGGLHGIACNVCKGKGITSESKTIPVKIPSGVNANSKLCIKGEGYGNGLLRGDLYLIVLLEKHKFFDIDENGNITCEIPISITEAVLGTELEVPTLKNSVKMKIPSCTQSNQILRLKGKGLKKRNEDIFLDQLIKINVVLPKKLTEKEKDLYTQLSLIERIIPRENFYK